MVNIPVEQAFMDKETIITELKRVAEKLQAQSISRSAFREHGEISAATVEANFGSWNEAIKGAGLTPLPCGGLPKSEAKRLDRLNTEPNVLQPDNAITDTAALHELIRLSEELGRRPSGNQVNAKGKYSSGIYIRRWGSVAKASEVAYEKYGNPLLTSQAKQD